MASYRHAEQEKDFLGARFHKPHGRAAGCSCSESLQWFQSLCAVGAAGEPGWHRLCVAACGAGRAQGLRLLSFPFTSGLRGYAGLQAVAGPRSHKSFQHKYSQGKRKTREGKQGSLRKKSSHLLSFWKTAKSWIVPLALVFLNQMCAELLEQ